jgi:hypothetical protein
MTTGVNATARITRMKRADSRPPGWLPLLQYQRVRGRTGLTIPFLIGVDWPGAMEKSAAFGALSSLLLSFRDETPSGHSVAIAECGDLHEPVAAIYPQGRGRADWEELPDPSGTTRLYVQRQYFQGRKRILESVLEAFWDRFGHHLARAAFSFRDGHYAPFDAEDRAFVERARRHRGN